jgi:hypothetical protein
MFLFLDLIFFFFGFTRSSIVWKKKLKMSADYEILLLIFTHDLLFLVRIRINHSRYSLQVISLLAFLQRNLNLGDWNF